MRIGLYLTLAIIVFINFNSAVYAKSEINTNSYSKLQTIINTIKSKLIEEESDLYDNNIPTWYPGFLIIQLIKGIFALILVLLILFDLIEP